MPAPATRYDAQLIERFGSIDAFHARRDSPDPGVWGPALDHIRIAENEKGLEQLRSLMSTLTAAGSYPDTDLVAQLDAVLNSMYELIDLREDTALSLEAQLGLTAFQPEPAERFDPHANLTPALGTTRTTPTPSPPVTGRHTPNSRTALTVFDARVEALAGDIDRLRAVAEGTQADPDLHELSARHLALTEAETACLFYRARINALTDGRWYVDDPLVETIDRAITDLEAHITTREDHAHALERHLARLEEDSAHDPARAASLMSAGSSAAVPVTSSDRYPAAQAVSPAAQRHSTAAVTQAVTPAPLKAAPAPVRHR